MNDWLSRLKYYGILFLKILLLLLVVAISVECVVDGWGYSSYMLWKIGNTISTIAMIVILVLTWKKTDFPEKWSMAFIFPFIILTIGTIIYGIENEKGPFIFGIGNPKLINILYMVVAVGITLIQTIRGKITGIIKIVIIAMAIITVIGFTIPLLLGLNLHQALQGQASSFLEALPFFLRPTFLGIFLFYPLIFILFIRELIISLRNKEELNRSFQVYPIIPVALLLIVGIRTLIISAPVEKVFSPEDFKDLKGRCNIVAHNRGGYILDFTSQKDFYDNAVSNLIDGDLDKGWESEENTPFPQDITIAIPGKNPVTIDQVIIYNAPKNNPSAAKEIEIMTSSGNPSDYKSAGNYLCQYTSIPQVFTFKKSVNAKFIKIRIYSNWGNSKTTYLKEIEVSGPETQDIQVEPLRGNLMADNSGIKPIYYKKIEELVEETTYKSSVGNEGPQAILQIEQSELPSEIVFNLPESKTYILDNLVLHFFSEENRPINSTELKEVEVLLSTDNPISGFNSVGRFLCTKGKATESISFLPQKAKYIKLRFLSPMEESKVILIKDMELYQPMTQIKMEENKDTKYQSGLKGMYFAGKNYKNFFSEKIDTTIDFSWGLKSPIAGMGGGIYSLCWQGRIQIPENGYYEIGVKATDNFQLKLNNQILMRKWDEKSITEEWITKKFRLTKGWYPVRIDYLHSKGSGMIKLAWKKPGQSSLQIIDRAYLSHEITDKKLDRTPREAVQSGVDWMAVNTLEWQDKNKCFCCHVQPSAIISFANAAKNDYKYDIPTVMKVMDFMRSGVNKEGYLSFPQADSLTALQFVALALVHYDNSIEEARGDDFLRIANYLVGKQMPEGNWKNDNIEPPLQQGDIMCTNNILLTLLKTYKKTGDKFFSTSIQRASGWMENASPQTTQDIAYQIIALSSYSTPNSEKIIRQNLEKLYNMQQEDGGWSEIEGYKSNSLSTGQVIYAMKLAKVDMSNQSYSRGIEYLMKNQNVFGSWPGENTQSKRPSEFGATMWAIAALSNSFESLMISITNPQSDESFNPKELKENLKIETNVYNSSSDKITSVEFFIDNKSIGKQNNPPYNIDWNPLKLSGGKHYVMAVVKTANGKQSSDTKTVFIDKSIKVTVLNPKEDENPPIDAKIQIQIQNQSNSPINKVEYFADNELITQLDKEPFDASWNTASLSNGKHILKVKATNQNGDSAIVEQTVNITRKLEIKLKKPVQGTIIEDEAQFSSNVINDSGSPTSKVEYYIEDKLVGTSTDEPDYKYLWKVSGIKNGDYTIKAVVYNKIGASADNSYTVSISNSLKIRLENIKEEMSLTGKKELKSTIINKSKSPIKEVIYYLNGRIIGKGTKPPYKIMWDTTEYASGDYTLKAIVYTKDGGKAHSEFNIKLEHPIKISLYATVVTEENKYTSQLQKEDFIVEEEGIIQNLLSLDRCNDKTPTSYCIAVEMGSNMSPYLEDTKKAIQNFASTAGDTSMMVFADSVMKKNKDIKKVIGDITPGGGSAIYDASMEAINMLKNSAKRKVVILFTSNIDENQEGTAPASKHKIDEILREASISNCIIYVVAIGEKADTFILSDLSDETGGRTYNTADGKGIAECINSLKYDLSYQYILKYNSSNLIRDGKWRPLIINIKDKPACKVNSQKGYFAPKY